MLKWEKNYFFGMYRTPYKLIWFLETIHLEWILTCRVRTIISISFPIIPNHSTKRSLFKECIQFWRLSIYFHGKHFREISAFFFLVYEVFLRVWGLRVWVVWAGVWGFLSSVLYFYLRCYLSFLITVVWV